MKIFSEAWTQEMEKHTLIKNKITKELCFKKTIDVLLDIEIFFIFELILDLSALKAISQGKKSLKGIKKLNLSSIYQS